MGLSSSMGFTQVTNSLLSFYNNWAISCVVIGRELWYESSCVDHGMDVMIAQVVCIYLSSGIFPRNWKPKTVNGIEKKKDNKFPYVCGASFDFNDFENFQSFIKWGQEVASSLD